MTASKIIVWRHGRTEWNRQVRFQGQADIGLDALGERQAKRAAAVLAGYEPTALFASDLARAFRTAGALAELTGLTITTDQRLREIHVGTWAGLTGPEVQAAEPEAYAKLRAGEDVRRSATGETVTEVGDRAAAALAEIGAATPDGACVVVASHGLALRAGIGRLIGLDPAQWRLLGSLDNCCWSSIEWHRGGGYWRLASYNVGVTDPELDSIS